MLELIFATTIVLYGDQSGQWSPSHCHLGWLPCDNGAYVERPYVPTYDSNGALCTHPILDQPEC